MSGPRRCGWTRVLGAVLVWLEAVPALAQMKMDMAGMVMPAQAAEQAILPMPVAPKSLSGHSVDWVAAAAGNRESKAASRAKKPANDHIAPADAQDRGTLSMAMGGKGMAMGDSPWLGMLLANELEWTGSPRGPEAAWDVDGWLGTPTQRLWLESEGTASSRQGSAARTELLFDQAMSRFWDWRVGYRQDAGDGPGRSWLAAGIQGLAAYWFQIEAMAYVSPQGRAGLRFEARYDLLLTQRLILSPKFETAIYSRGDPRRELGGGLSEADLGLRLRYEFSRKFAPYLGVGWNQRFGATASWARRDQIQAEGMEWMVGARIWF